MVSKLLALFLTVGFVAQLTQAKHTEEEIAAFQANYQAKLDAYLATKTNSTAECIDSLITQLDKCRHAPYNQMMQYSLHAIGDLGDNGRCMQIPDVDSSYAVLSLNVSTTPVFIRQGICLPAACTQGMYNDFSTRVSNKLTTLIQAAVLKFGIDIYILPQDTKVEISIVDTTTVYSTSEYSLAVQAADGSGSNDDVPGVYGPQTNVALFWIIVVLLSLWIIFVLAISLKYFIDKRKATDEEKRNQELARQAQADNLIPVHFELQQAENYSSFFVRIMSIQYAVDGLSKPRGSGPKYEDLKLMDGMRVLCLLWVMMLGVCQFTMASAVYNPWTLQKYFQTYGYTAVYSSNLGFDEFFFFSSMLMTLKISDLIDESLNQGKMSFFQYLKLLALRYIRLAPLYYLVFLFGWQVGPYLGDGPCWFTYEKGFSNCSDYWWSVFTMTINFIPNYVIANEGCFYWGWYPPCELQVFIILPWVAYMLIKTRHGALQALLVTFGVLIGIAINFYVIWSNEMAAGLFAPQDILIFKLFVIKPYTKVHACFLGIGMALLYQSIQASKLQRSSFWTKLRKSNLFGIVGWLLALTVIGFVTLYPLPANKNPVKWSNLHNSLFISLSRPLFVMGIMLMMTLMILDHGRMLKSFFSLAFWVPLSRLSYLVYLIFPIIDAVLISSMNQALFLSYYTMFYLLAFNFAFCMIAGFFCHILIEGPLMNLILAWRIRAQESEARLQENLKQLDKNVRAGSEYSQMKPNFSNEESMSRSNRQTERQLLSKDYFTTVTSRPSLGSRA